MVGIPATCRILVEPGVALNLLNWGGPQGSPTAILLHGSAEGAFVWDEFARELSRCCQVLAVDLRGHGGSDRDPENRYDFAKHVGDISRLINTLQLDSVLLIGHSLGGRLAARIAPSLGDRLRALVVVDSGPCGDVEAARHLEDQLRESYTTYARIEDYFRWLRDRRYLATPAVLERLAAASLVSGPDGFTLRYDVAVLDMVATNQDDGWWLTSFSEIAAPVLVVRGIGSALLSRAVAQRMCAAAPRGELAVVSAAGHAVMNDNVEGFAQAVLPFCRKCL